MQPQSFSYGKMCFSKGLCVLSSQAVQESCDRCHNVSKSHSQHEYTVSCVVFFGCIAFYSCIVVCYT